MNFRPKDLEYLEKTLKRNAPYKVRGGSFGDDKIIEVCNGIIDYNIILNTLIINIFILSLRSKPLFLKRRFRKRGKMNVI